MFSSWKSWSLNLLVWEIAVMSKHSRQMPLNQQMIGLKVDDKLFNALKVAIHE